jgi:hypothetical protein
MAKKTGDERGHMQSVSTTVSKARHQLRILLLRVSEVRIVI